MRRHPSDTRAQGGRASTAMLACLAIVSAVVALAIAVGGGFVWRVAGLRLAARSTSTPALLAVALAGLTWILMRGSERRAAAARVRALFDTPRRWIGPLVVAISLAVLAFAIAWNTRAAGGSDSYGYVSEAALWAHGSLIVQQPFAEQPGWPTSSDAVIPLGYQRYESQEHPAAIVPKYSAGLPLLMALFQVIGGPSAVFLVGPLLGAALVYAAYAIGARLADETTGLASAILLASSPSFLFEVTSPTSDVPAAAWWALAIALVGAEAAWTAPAAGLCVSAAILTRPNLFYVAVFPAAFLLSQAAARRGSRTLRSFVAFALCASIGPMLVAAINTHLYGSPTTSGYGSLSGVFGLQYIGANLARYPTWFYRTQTPVVLLAFAAPFAWLRAGHGESARATRAYAAMLAGVAVTVTASYMIFVPWNEWGYLRFLLPAYAPVMSFVAVGAQVLTSPLGRVRSWMPAVATIAIVTAAATWTLRFAAQEGVLDSWKGERRYVVAGQYVARRLPEGAALLSLQHSGSARFYSGRITIRYDLLPSDGLDRIVSDLERLGHPPYALLDDHEEAEFRTRFPRSRIAALDWMPVALISGRKVRLYDLTEARAPSSRNSPDVVE
jgi:hypothetical protein